MKESLRDRAQGVKVVSQIKTGVFVFSYGGDEVELYQYTPGVWLYSYPNKEEECLLPEEVFMNDDLLSELVDDFIKVREDREQYKNDLVDEIDIPSDYFTNEVVTSETGAKQSNTPCRMDLIPSVSLLEVSKVLKQGADKYGENNWMGIPTNEHLNHALVHIYGWIDGDRSENHLVNASCRLLFAVYTELKGVKK